MGQKEQLLIIFILIASIISLLSMQFADYTLFSFVFHPPKAFVLSAAGCFCPLICCLVFVYCSVGSPSPRLEVVLGPPICSCQSSLKIFVLTYANAFRLNQELFHCWKLSSAYMRNGLCIYFVSFIFWSIYFAQKTICGML